MKNFDVRYLDNENRWVFTAPTELALPQTAVNRIKEHVRARWAKELSGLSDFKHGSKKEFITRAIQALDAGRISQIQIGDNGFAFTSTERTGAIISHG